MDTGITRRLNSEIDRILPHITEQRHTLHQNPEIARKEHRTAGLIRKSLKPLGIRLLKPYLETDVVAILEGKRKGKGKGEGKNITLRADMDALPVQEKTGLPYASRRNGFMHACGHDGHTAMLMGTTLVLSQFKDEINGSVRFVFQPGEEVVAAGKDLVEKGVLQDPEPDAVIALHAWPGIREGMIASKPGVLMAAADFFRIKIIGKGAHGARPENSIDPILTAARVVESLQSVVSRNVSALDPLVISVCRITGGTNSNVIPDSVEMEGTTRYLEPELGKKIFVHMKRVVKGVCDSMGASCEITYSSPYVPTVNDPTIVDLGKNIAKKVLGSSCWMELREPSMGGEDFAYYIRDYPGAMFRIGMGKGSASLHNPQFDFNDAALKNGILFLASTALEFLGT